jgi:hypothetical protein
MPKICRREFVELVQNSKEIRPSVDESYEDKRRYEFRLHNWQLYIPKALPMRSMWRLGIKDELNPRYWTIPIAKHKPVM